MDGSHCRLLSARKPRILFVAEAVSLAHVVRLALLAGALERTRYEVWFASARFPELVFAGTQLQRRVLFSQSPEHTLSRVTRGKRPWDEAVLERYVASDLALLEEIRPDLVVGDFRLSLAISAPLSGTPYASLINAYWSPYGVRDAFPIPEHPLIRMLGVERVARRYRFALPLMFRHYARPIDRLRRRYGLSGLGGLLETLTFGDYTLYADVPELAPTRDAPANHRYLGALSWSPRAPLPAFWERIDPVRPLVYCTLGSSGELRTLDAVLEAARRLPITLLVASAGRFAPRVVSDNVCVTDFVPGDVVAKRASLVICNGGSTTGYQALEQGTPVLGLPFNFDQYLASETITRAGAGLYLRSGDATARTVAAAVERLLYEDRFAAGARRMRGVFARYDARSRFRAFIEETTYCARVA
jgi:UDP:flavonoid glycosyltransferase YjiC (YdhE family)